MGAQINQSPKTLRSTLLSRNRQKIFCIGCNKTGTTSLAKALKDLGFFLGDQRTAEIIAARDWPNRQFDRIIRYCRTAQAFQDAPFSFPETYKALDAAYPNSKFILTVRDSPDQWYDSITRFHSKVWGNGTTHPSMNDLKKARYIYRGFPWDLNRFLFSTPESEPYRKNELLSYYETHNANVQEHFKNRRNDLLILNVAEDNAYQRLCAFLGLSSIHNSFPWKNKTCEIKGDFK